MQPWRDRLYFLKKNEFSKLTGALWFPQFFRITACGMQTKRRLVTTQWHPSKAGISFECFKKWLRWILVNINKKNTNCTPKLRKLTKIYSRWRWSCHVPIIEKSSICWRLSHYNLNVELHFPCFADSAESADSGVFAQLRLNLATGTTGATRATGEARFSPSVAWKRLPSDSTNLI